MHQRLALLLVSLAAAFNSPVHAATLTTDFNTLPHQSAYEGTTFINGGITFSQETSVSQADGFDIQFDDTNDLQSFVQQGVFLPPNYLTFTGYVPDGSSFGAFGTMSMAFNGTASAAELTLMGSSYGGIGEGNVLTLDAYSYGALVGSSTFTVPDDTLFAETLSISGVSFNSLKLVSNGGADGGSSLIGVTNVELTTAPEPSTYAMVLGGLGLLVWVSRFRRRLAA